MESANDTATLSVAFENGAAGVIQLSALAHIGERNQDLRIALHGDAGTPGDRPEVQRRRDSRCARRRQAVRGAAGPGGHRRGCRSGQPAAGIRPAVGRRSPLHRCDPAGSPGGAEFPCRHDDAGGDRGRPSGAYHRVLDRGGITRIGRPGGRLRHVREQGWQEHNVGWGAQIVGGGAEALVEPPRAGRVAAGALPRLVRFGRSRRVPVRAWHTSSTFDTPLHSAATVRDTGWCSAASRAAATAQAHARRTAALASSPRYPVRGSPRYPSAGQCAMLGGSGRT